jgi:glycosyltransferase involved in cell wall biosynthesis
MVESNVDRVVDMPAAPDTKPIRVVIDAQSLSSDAAGSGIATYTQCLIAGLARRPDVEVVALSESTITLPPRAIRAPITRRVKDPRTELMEHLVRLPIDLHRVRQKGDVFHNPVFHAPVGMRTPWVQTLHDVIPLATPSADAKFMTDRWKRFGPRYLKASAVIAISNHAAKEGIKYLGLDPAKVHVAHHGVDPIYVPDPAGPSDPPYLLLVNEFSMRKGYGEAFAVFDALVDAGYRHRLVVVGKISDLNRDKFNKVLGGAVHRDKIDVLEFVPDLLPVYQGASMFLMTSHYEGFGLTPLEAMACGVPVVAFSNSSVTEVVEGGGQLVADGDVSAMITAVKKVLDSPAAAAEWRQQGLAHSRTFTWDASAALHAEVYRSVAAHR